MPRGKARSKSPKAGKSTAGGSASGASVSSGTSAKSDLPSAGYLLTCDPPAKQFIKHLNETKRADKRFIVEDLDATHLLIKESAKEEVLRKVEAWMDENVFTNVERLGENLDTS